MIPKEHATHSSVAIVIPIKAVWTTSPTVAAVARNIRAGTFSLESLPIFPPKESCGPAVEILAEHLRAEAQPGQEVGMRSLKLIIGYRYCDQASSR